MGTHTINSIHKFLAGGEEDCAPGRSVSPPARTAPHHSLTNGFSHTEDSPLTTNTLIALDYVGPAASQPVSLTAVLQGTCSIVTPAKKDINDKDIRDAHGAGEDSDDEENMDWWTKYFASVDLMIKVGKL